ncbi:MAG TPA: VCBS repeat-containing protein, partial [bacterium]|nr:VCBS repeat-containing protein [bacterium]
MPSMLHQPLVRLALFGALASTTPAQSFQPLQAPLGIGGVLNSISFNGSGMCVADFDGDRDMDIVVASIPGLPFRYFRNDGGMQFSDLTATCGMGNSGIVLCMSAADIDNDGDQDIWVGGDFQPGQLFINNGNGVFTEEAALRGISNSSQNYGVTFGDYDRDGWLDIYLGNRYDSLTGSSGG